MARCSRHMTTIVWGNNADAISILYAGTGALKTDFTRTGKRTKKGLVMDGWKSCVRYVLNNFYDGYRQHALDLLLRKHVPARSESFDLARKDRETWVAVFESWLSKDSLKLLMKGEYDGERFCLHGSVFGRRFVVALRPLDGCRTSWKRMSAKSD